MTPKSGVSEAGARRPKNLTFVLADIPASTLGLNLTDKAVLRCLVDHLNSKRNGTEVWPSNARIAELTGAHPETVGKSKLRLHENGFIKIRRDSGKSDMCTINVAMIRALADPPANTGGSAAHPPGNPGGYPPVNTGGTPPEIPPRREKEPLNRTRPPDLFPFSGSATLKVGDGDQQRKLALLGIVTEASDRMRIDREEPPTKEKDGESPALPIGMRRVRERPG